MLVSSQQRYPEQQNPDIEDAAARLSISVLCSESGTFRVRLIELASGRFVKRISYSDENALEKIFGRQFCQLASDILNHPRNAGQGDERPEFRTAQPGLVLGRLRIVRKVTKEGNLIVIRFGECFGNVSSIFRCHQDGWETGHGQIDILAVETLERVVMPLLGLSKQIETDLPTTEAVKESDLLEGLLWAKKQIDGMEFYYNLLIDYMGANGRQPKRRTVEALAALSHH